MAESDNALIRELENLKGPHAKIMGYDYYNVTALVAVALGFMMVVCYFILESEP